MARERGEYAVGGRQGSHARRRARAVALGREQFVGEASDELRGIVSRQERRYGAHHHRGLAERFDLEPEGRGHIGAFRQRRAGRGREVEGQRQEERLLRDPAPLPAGSKALVEDALVGGVLVDQQERGGGFHEQVVALELSEEPEVRESHPGAGTVAARVARGVRAGGLVVRRRRERQCRRAGEYPVRDRGVADTIDGQRLPGSGLGRRSPEPRPLSKSLLHGTRHEMVYGARICEPHLPLRRVYVDIDRLRRNVEEDHRRRKSPARQDVAVGVQDGMAQQSVANGPSVHEQVQALCRRPMPIGSRDESVDPRLALLPARLDEGGGVGLGEYGGDAGDGLSGGGPDLRRAIVAYQLEVHSGAGQRHPRRPVGDVPPLGGGGLHELAPGGDPAEEVRDLDAGSLGAPCRPLVDDAPLFDPQLEALGGSPRAGP